MLRRCQEMVEHLIEVVSLFEMSLVLPGQHLVYCDLLVAFEKGQSFPAFASSQNMNMFYLISERR